MAGERLARILADNRNVVVMSNFLFGNVTSINPLKVKVNDLPELEEDLLIIGLSCLLEKKTEEPKPVEKTRNKEPEKTESKEYYSERQLKVGDVLLLIRSNDGQRFYAAERII